jgi:molybdopterin-dependent oxidoreductase alpha subunit
VLSILQSPRPLSPEIVAVNPLRERGLVSFTHPQEAVASLLGRGTELATVYLQPKVGSDVALLKGIMKHVLEAERRAPGHVLDHGFLRAHTMGLDALLADLEATSWTRIEEETGLGQEEIRTASEVYIRSRATILCWAMGLTQHEHGVENVVSCSNLLLLKGNIGRPGAGPCPVRGHSNVQGDRTVGITSSPAPEFLDALAGRYGFDPPRANGMDVVDAISAMGEGRVRYFMTMGGNFASASPDTGATIEGLERVELAVHVATKLNRTHAVSGREAMIWPCLGRTERDEQAGGAQFVTVEDSMSCVHSSRGRNPPASPHLRSEPSIVGGLARAVFGEDTDPDWRALAGDYDRIREEIEAVLPGFDDYNRRVRQPGGFVLRHSAAHREWDTASGKAELVAVPTPEIRLAEGELRMFTIRSHDQYNTTVYGLDDRYRGLRGVRRVILMHPDDVAERGLRPGDEVDLVSRGADRRERRAPRFKVVGYDVPRGCAATYFPEANVLVPLGSHARESRTPASKLVPITVEPASSAVRIEGPDERVVPADRAGAGPP